MTDHPKESGTSAPRYLTLPEATDRVPVSIVTLRREIKAGRLAAFKVAGKILIRPEDLRAWIEAGRVKADPMPAPKRRPGRLIDQVLSDEREAA